MSRPVKRYMALLRDAIWYTLQCKAFHLETIEVVEVFQGKIVWEGDVELFVLYSPRKGERCFAWGFPNGSAEWEVIVALRKPPIRSAQDAVKAAILKDIREGRLK